MAKRRAYTKKAIQDWAKQLTSSVTEINDDLEDRTRTAVDKIMTLADEYVPEDTKLTKHSAYSEVVQEKGRIRAEFGYDKFNEVEYLAFIYNDVERNWIKAGARAQWLDVAFQELKDEAYDIIAGKR